MIFGEKKFGTRDIRAIALKTAALPKRNETRPRIVVFTQGAKPTIVARGTLKTLNTHYSGVTFWNCDNHKKKLHSDIFKFLEIFIFIFRS